MNKQVDYAKILRRAAKSLAVEGRHNQASILRDAAAAFDELRAENKQLHKAQQAAQLPLTEAAGRDG